MRLDSFLSPRRSTLEETHPLLLDALQDIRSVRPRGNLHGEKCNSQVMLKVHTSNNGQIIEYSNTAI